MGNKDIPTTPAFDVDVAVVYRFVEVIFINHFLGNKGDWHLIHVLISVHGCSKIEIVNIEAHPSGTFSRDGAVDDKFGSGCIGCWCADVAWIVDKIATNGEAGPFWFSFFRTIVDAYSSLGYILASVFRNFVVVDEEDVLGSFDSFTNTLCYRRPNLLARDFVHRSLCFGLYG